VVSHDRYLLERVCDRQVALLGDGTLRDLPGGVAEYLERRAAARAAAGGIRAGAMPSAAAPAQPSTGARTQADVRQARKDLARIERRLARVAEREAELHTAMAANAADHTVLLALGAELRSVEAEQADLEEAWLLAAEASG
jgi:ATPase subunit of ABC transporter with duplicated ATPase domains